MGVFSEAKSDAVSPALLAVLPKNPKPWWQTRHLLLLNLMLIGPMLSAASFGYDGSMVNGLQTLPQWTDYFHHPTASRLGAINAVWPVGQFLGIFPTTWISDRYGRKTPMYIGFFVLALATALQGGAQNLAMFIVARFLFGFGTSFMYQPAPILITELAYPTHRGKVTALYNTNNWLGSIYAAWLIYGTRTIQSTWAWRIPSILQGSFTVAQILPILLLPESPRYLVSKDRLEEARRFFTKWHAGGDESSALVAFEMAEITENIRVELLVGSQSSYFDLFRTAANRRRVLIGMIVGFIFTWCGVAVISYYITLVLDTAGITSTKSQDLINGLLQVFNFIVAVTGALLVDRAGRRPLFLFSAIGMLVSFICMTALSAEFTKTKSVSIGHSVIAFVFIFQMFYDIALVPMAYAYVLELFPYTLRGRGLTVSLTTTYLGLTVGQVVNPIALTSIGWKYYNVFTVLLLIYCVLVYFLFPETRRKSLEEIAEVFGDEKIHMDVKVVADGEGNEKHLETHIEAVM